jgi:hypothetical protein
VRYGERAVDRLPEFVRDEDRDRDRKDEVKTDQECAGRNRYALAPAPLPRGRCRSAPGHHEAERDQRDSADHGEYPGEDYEQHHSRQQGVPAVVPGCFPMNASSRTCRIASPVAAVNTKNSRFRTSLDRL